MKPGNVFRFIWKALVMAFLLMPLLVTLVYSFAGRWVHILPEGFTLEYYARTLSDSKFLLGVLRGLVISIIPVALTLVSVLAALYAAIVYFPQAEKIVQLFCLLPSTINGIILATSVLGAYSGSGTILSNRIVMLVCIYSVFILPMTYQGVRNSLYAVNTKALLEAAEMLGCRKSYCYVTVVIPSILPGLCNASLVCMSGLFGDFAIIKIIASSQFETAHGVPAVQPLP